MNGADECRALIAAYRAASYSVRLPGGRRVGLEVGAECPGELNDLLLRTAHSAGGLITAWNPLSVQSARSANRLRQRELLAALHAARAGVLAGVGSGNDWREPSLAALGVRVDLLDELARHFGQNAILSFRAGEPVRLRLYRDEWREALSGDDVDFAAPVAR